MLSILFSLGLRAKEIVCLPKFNHTSLDEIVLSKESRGNTYNIKVMKDRQAILNSEVKYTFLRRKQIAVFKNKDQSVVIKTRKLFTNQVTDSSIVIKSIFDGSIKGFCKQYPSLNENWVRHQAYSRRYRI